MTGEPKIDETAAKLPAAAIRPTAWSGASRLTRRIASVPSPMPDRDQGALGSEHEPEPERRQRRQQHSGQVDRSGRRATGLEPVDGHMTAVSGQAHDGKRGQQPREGHPRKRPPERDGVVADVLRQVLVHPHLELVNPSRKHHDAAETTSPTNAASTSSTR